MGITPERLKALLAFERLSLTLQDVARMPADRHVAERLRFRLGEGQPVHGLLTRPGGAMQRPAILHCHADHGRCDIGAAELLAGRPARLEPAGPALAREGYVVLSIDMPTLGTQAGNTDDAAAKGTSRHGQTLFGRMLSAQAAALTWLGERPDVDPDRIAVTGLSEGATLAYVLAAIDPRPAVVAHLCGYGDLAAQTATGAHDPHGRCLAVAGLLQATSTGEIAGLVAPRPQLICIGEDDPLTPPAAVATALQATQAAYARAPAALVFLSQPGVGHRETPAMRRALITFLNSYL